MCASVRVCLGEEKEKKYYFLFPCVHIWSLLFWESRGECSAANGRPIDRPVWSGNRWANVEKLCCPFAATAAAAAGRWTDERKWHSRMERVRVLFAPEHADRTRGSSTKKRDGIFLSGKHRYTHKHSHTHTHTY